MLLPTSLVGSYPQPDWLIDRERLSKDVPRIRANDLWRVDADRLEAAQDDATILAIRDQERAGLTIITDGESGHDAQPDRQAHCRAARRRPDPAQGRSARPRP
jgi:5-methyltetrahydropteroyltriglutamate--homocysteine methyltransferase